MKKLRVAEVPEAASFLERVPEPAAVLEHVPETVAKVPETVTKVLETVTVPETVTVISETVAKAPETVTVISETVTVPMMMRADCLAKFQVMRAHKEKEAACSALYLSELQKLNTLRSTEVDSEVILKSMKDFNALWEAVAGIDEIHAKYIATVHRQALVYMLKETNAKVAARLCNYQKTFGNSLCIMSAISVKSERREVLAALAKGIHDELFGEGKSSAREEQRLESVRDVELERFDKAEALDAPRARSAIRRKKQSSGRTKNARRSAAFCQRATTITSTR